MSFPKYAHYKGSGIEWLPDPPAHWNTGRLRWLATLYAGGTPDKKNESYWTDGDVPWLNSGAVNQQLITEPSAFITQEALENSSAKWVPANALVIALAGQGKTKGMVAQVDFRTTCNQSMAAIIPSNKLNPRFLMWWLSSNYQNIRNLSGGDLRDGLNLQLLGTIACPLPPSEEQTNIANFLDAETAKIDALVAEQRRLIELLKEKRQAVISHAVTKGLNPNAPMKDSGIEWLGDVPEHWEMKRLKHISPAITVGIVVNPSTFATNMGLPFIHGGDIREGVINFCNARRISREASEINSKTKLIAGDVLTVRVGAGRGTTAVVPPECTGGNCASVMLVRKGEFNSDWLCFAMNDRLVQFQIKIIEYGAAQPQFNISHAIEFWFPFPPQREQDEIAEYLANKSTVCNQLIMESERAIKLLQERRTALISAAVTGKIDVREYATQEPA